MGHMGGKKHLKRLYAPKTWRILRKVTKFTTKPSSGPHAIENSIPLRVALRDVLKICDARKEADYLIKSGNVKVDNRVVKNPKFPIGFMDVLDIKGKYFRVLYDALGRIVLKEIDKDTDVKLCKIENKTKVKGGKTQLNLHDGRNILIDEDVYKVGDSVLIRLPSQEIVDHIKMSEGNLVYVFRGKHTGEIGKIKEIIPGTLTSPAKIVINKDDEEINTLKEYCFVIGKDKERIDVIL
jgi:small subunit ribosomal protein S4e